MYEVRVQINHMLKSHGVLETFHTASIELKNQKQHNYLICLYNKGKIESWMRVAQIIQATRGLGGNFFSTSSPSNNFHTVPKLQKSVMYFLAMSRQLARTQKSIRCGSLVHQLTNWIWCQTSNRNIYISLSDCNHTASYQQKISVGGEKGE